MRLINASVCGCVGPFCSADWVIFGLLGYAATFGVGIGILSPLAKRIEQSAEQNGPTHPETLALIDRIMLIARIDVAVLMLVVLDMVTKPFA